MRILGVDPGFSTGLAIYNTETLRFEYMEQTGRGVKGFKGPFLTHFFEGYYPVQHMSCENFTLRASNKFTADLAGVEIIGWLKGEGYWGQHNPEPSQHMTLTRLRKNKDNYAESVVTKMLRRDGYLVGAGHCRMAGSVAMWYAAMILKHEPTLELLKPKDKK